MVYYQSRDLDVKLSLSNKRAPYNRYEAVKNKSI